MVDTEEACSPWVRTYRHEFLSRPDEYFNVVTGESFAVTRAGPGGGRVGKVTLRDGVLIGLEGGGVGLLEANGRVRWELAGSVVQNQNIVAGHLAIRDGTGTYFVVDQVTGREGARFSELPGKLYDNNHWEGVTMQGALAWRPADQRWACPRLKLVGG